MLFTVSRQIFVEVHVGIRGVEYLKNKGDDAVNEEENEAEALEDPSVPTELLELHVSLEDAGITPEEFKEIFGS